MVILLYQQGPVYKFKRGGAHRPIVISPKCIELSKKIHVNNVLQLIHYIQWVPFRSGHFICAFRDSSICVKCITTYHHKVAV